uniref:Apple domain-containing protein n=1 Tax=Macrostomum lignano TaxID=282301 RepID=A0A1I8JFH6_9PLAT
CLLYRLLLLVAFAAVNQANDCQSRRTFSLANASSLVAPLPYHTIPSATDPLRCSMQCRSRPDLCFGFYYQTDKTTCSLFNASSFFRRKDWINIFTPGNIYSSIFGDEIIQLPISGCEQSSTASGAVCSRAIDGNLNQQFASNSCTLTAYLTGDKDWWEASLA